MDGLQELFTTIFNLLICLAPLAVLGVLGVIGVVVLVSFQRNRREKIRAVLAGIADMDLPGITTVAMHGQATGFQSVNELAGAADMFQQISKGDENLLSAAALNALSAKLMRYRQVASFGSLPTEKLNTTRIADQARIDSFVKQVENLKQAFANYNLDAVRRSLVDIDESIIALYDNHLAFRQELSESEILFPIPQPTTAIQPAGQGTITQSEFYYTEILKQLPDDRQMLFMMHYNGVKKNPQTAVLLAVLLGGVGAHRFYLGEMGVGVIYLLFSWTWIPAIIGVIEAFTISRKVNQLNARKAYEIAVSFGLNPR